MQKDIAVAGVAAVGLGALLGYNIFGYATKLQKAEEIRHPEGYQPEIEEVANQTELVDIINDGVQYGDVKVFEPGEHYVSVRVNVANDYNHTMTGSAINNIPEGYSVFQIVPFENNIRVVDVGGYDIWFVNDQTVEVTASYHEHFGNWGYYTFGTIVEEMTNTRTR